MAALVSNSPVDFGQPLTRVDAKLKVTGAAKFSAEFAPANLAYGALIQSTIASGRVTKIDISAVKSAPGVIAVITLENAPRFKPYPDQWTKKGAPGESRVPLENDDVHWSGQHLGIVVADTFERAAHAASLARVEYQSAKPVVWPDDTEEKDKLAPETFIGREKLQVKRGDVDNALATAAAKIDAVYSTPVQNHNPIETHSTTAQWEAPDRLLVHDSTRGIKLLQRILANAFGIPIENVRIVSPFVGGAFGSKGFQWSHILLCAAAAKEAKRPVKLTFTRPQMFDSAGQRARTIQKFSMGTDKSGKLIALRHATLTHCSPVSEYTEPCGNTSRMLYSCPNVEVTHRLVKLNLTTPCPMRAPGEAPGVFALECAMDEIAEASGLDPLEFRLRNYAENDDYENKPWSSKRLRECYERGAKKFGWEKRKTGSMRDKGGNQIGLGMATAVYPALQQTAAAHAVWDKNGFVTISSATHEIGTGTYTTMSQIAANSLGIPLEKIRFHLGDSRFPEAPVNGGSWLTASVGPAVIGVCEELKKKQLANAPFPIEADFKSDPNKEEREKFSYQSFGAIFVEVAVDLFGQVRIKRAVSVYDVGRILNPRLARSQIMGGNLFGFGMALMEGTVPDVNSGRIVNANLAEYQIPVCADVPEFDIDFIDEPDPHMPGLGARGIGEIGIVGAPAAVANAIFHATGKRVRDLPITPDKLI
jgi:xanthine dehydrogenase YagR molybdenum-binding subunit